MKAAVLGENGLEIRDVPAPKPKPDEILVRVRACGLNRAEVLMASGYRHGSQGGPGTIVGLEWSGEVVEAGAQVKDLKPGQRVMCSGGGGYAEYAVADAGRCSTIPANNMTFEQAATLPIGLQTMHDAIMTQGRMKQGDSVLIQAASAGVGIIGLQIAKLMGAKLVMGTSTKPEKRARLKDYGCDLAFDSRDPKWPDQVIEATGGKGVDLIIDLVSAGVANDNMKATRVLGRIVNIGRLGGFKGEFDFDLHALKRIDYVGATFRTRSTAEVHEIVRRMRADLWPLVEAGKFNVPIDRTFPLAEAAAAQAHMRSNAHFGKIVLTVGS
ncbi:MAG TPA: zinc-binding dehydrogenase [Stellaceae bacterium]|nr:zinc-binding dehydrogenase [Stellaceae bacterium]